jgi:putative Mn2+ efflux pump MntP
MDLRIPAVAIAIGLDVLAVSTAIGIKGLPWPARLRMGAAFSSAEIIMQVIGLGLGTGLGHFVGEIAGWLGLVVLAAIGVVVLRESFSHEDEIAKFDVNTASGLFFASIAISLDSLGLGFALPIMRLPLLQLFGTVIFTTVLFTMTGLAFGATLGRLFEKSAERGSGIALILLAIAFALQKIHW